MTRITNQNRQSISPIKVDLANLVLVGSLLTMLLLTGCSGKPTRADQCESRGLHCTSAIDSPMPLYVWNTNLDKQIPQY